MLAPLFWHRFRNYFQLSIFWFIDVSLIFLSQTRLIYGTSQSRITLKSIVVFIWWFFKVQAWTSGQAVFWACGCRGIRLDAAASSSRVANAAASIYAHSQTWNLIFLEFFLPQTFPISPILMNLVNIKEKCQYIVWRIRD